MPTVNIATNLAPTEFPAGTNLGQMRYRLSVGSTLKHTVYLDAPFPPTVSIQGVLPGTYTLTIARLTTLMSVIGPVHTSTVVVPEPVVVVPPPVVGDAPVGAEVTVS